MGYVIAMAGKGGTGKTTAAALIVRLLKEEKRASILAIDADPNSNLGENLGISPKESIGSILDEIGSHPEKIPADMGKDHYIEYRVQRAVEEADGFDLLTMGRPEGPGCYCYVNNSLRNVMQKLIKDYDYVVIDNEAGLEHLSRRTTRSADVLLLVSDATVVGLKAVKRISDLVKELGIKIGKELLLVNRAAKIDKDKLKGLKSEFLGLIPEDKEIEKISLNGSSLLKLDAQSPGITALRKLGEGIWHCK